MTTSPVPRHSHPSPETIGEYSTTIQVELSARFLEHFSEQLYSSPQKAFEELISNGWDAGADHVDIRISTDLQSPNATMCVLDNGSSMDESGLRGLWHIAFSPKSGTSEQHGRPIIGQFGIGKLATYVLANKLTYICKDSNGVIRRVTMDYGDIDRQKGTAKDRLISELELGVYKVTESEVADALDSVCDGATLLDLIQSGVVPPTGGLGEDEFGGVKSTLQKPPSGTWTLVVLSDLKPSGRNLKLGVLRRMLAAALPFGCEMAITINGELLASSKTNLPLLAEWTLGPDLGIDSVELVPDEDEEPGTRNESLVAGDDDIPEDAPKTTLVRISSGLLPVPYIDIPGIGQVTGRVRLFADRISGGKSDERGASNGFHVNVLGRVVNQSDPSFGEANLNHAAWARFRATVRADGLNDLLTTNREQFKEGDKLRVFRALLRRLFNKARTFYDSEDSAAMPHGGDVLVRSLGVVSLSPLRNVVSESLRTQSPIPGLFDETGIDDRERTRDSWREHTAEHISNALGRVNYERCGGGSFVTFRIADNTIVVNREHPFAEEYCRTKAEKELVRTIAMVTLLTDVYALDIGISPGMLEHIREYRDRLMRFSALKSRKSGTYIARLLLETQHDSSNSRYMEAVVSDALRYLGFQVRDLAKSGEPEGIASAYPLPTVTSPTLENPDPPLYSFSFDAKASRHKATKTANIGLDAVVEHRNRYRADYALVIAPGFTGEAVVVRCTEQKVTPMTAQTLGQLLEYTVESGAIPVTKLREVFNLYDPERVTEWVKSLGDWLKEQRPLTIDVFLRALERLKGKVPDVLPAAMIAYECREGLGAASVKGEHVIAVAHGLSILVPDLVGIDGDKIVVNASSSRVAAAVAGQLEKLHSDADLD